MVSNNPVMNVFSPDFGLGGSPGAGYGGNSPGNSLGGWNMNSLFDMGGSGQSTLFGGSNSLPYGNFDPFSVMGLNSGYGTENYQSPGFSLSDSMGSAGNGYSFNGGDYTSSILTGSEDAGMVDFQNLNAQYGVGGLFSSLGIDGMGSGPVVPPVVNNYVAPPAGEETGPPPVGGSAPAAGPTPPPANGSPPPAGGSPPAGPTPAPGSNGGNVNDWIAQAQKALAAAGVPADKMNAKDIATIIQHESSGDPNAVNNWDYNAQAGTPSQGLMQTIPATFSQYKLPGHDSITNPVDNIIAGVQYAIARYGSVSNVPGVVQVNNGGQYVGY